MLKEKKEPQLFWPDACYCLKNRVFRMSAYIFGYSGEFGDKKGSTSLDIDDFGKSLNAGGLVGWPHARD